MRFATRIAVFVALVAAVADAPALGQRRGGGPNTDRPQTAEDAPGRGRGGGQQGARDGGRGGRAQLRTGTASIRGRVVNATSGVPVRRASIRATSVNDQGESAGRSATTDDNGGFELRDLPAGRWTLRAAKTGYVEQQFGQRSALASVDPVTLAEGQQFVADFRLTRGGAISGHILDEFGDPVAGANVTAMRLQATAQGQRTTRTGTSVPSDDTGAYRIYGLPPGQYYVSVNDPSAARMLVFSPDGSDSVRVEAAESFVTAGRVTLVVDEGTTRTSYAPTYYPGTANIADAQRLTLGLGEDRSGVTLTIVPARTARITGRVMGANGAPSRATVSLVGALNQSFSPSGGRSGASTDGAFTLTNVPPGNYTLNVLGPNVGAAPPEVASMPLVVNGEDILGLTVVTGSGANLQGSIVAENGGRLPASRIRVTASPVQNNPATWTPRAEVNENGTFALEGMLGIYTLRFESLPSGWIVKSITANGIDVSDAAIELRPGDRVSVRVELTDRITQVSGTVRPTRDVRGGTVVVFADEPSKWTSSSRFVKTAKVADDGRFTISGLPPHQRYLAVAVDYVESGEAQSPEFLQRAKAASSTSFGLVAGGQQVLDLPLVVR